MMKLMRERGKNVKGDWKEEERVCVVIRKMSVCVCVGGHMQ